MKMKKHPANVLIVKRKLKRKLFAANIVAQMCRLKNLLMKAFAHFARKKLCPKQLSANIAAQCSIVHLNRVVKVALKRMLLVSLLLKRAT